MKFGIGSRALAALATTFVFFAAPARAQGAGYVIGQGTYQAATQDVAHFNYVARRHTDGSADGIAIWRVGDSLLLIRLTSSTVIHGAVAVAGPVVAILGELPPPQFGLEVDGTAYFAVQDNGPGSADRTTGISGVPAVYGRLTIQQIIALGGGGGPPPAAFRPLLSGNILVF